MTDAGPRRAVDAVFGALLLAAIGAGFAAEYLCDHERWWAVIPAAALAVLVAPEATALLAVYDPPVAAGPDRRRRVPRARGG